MSARPNDPPEVPHPSHALSSSSSFSEDDNDLVIINPSEVPLTSSMEINEKDYATRLEMSIQIRGLERKISKAEQKRAVEVEALQAEIAQLRDVIAKVSIATEDTMTCDVLYTSSHKVFVLACGHIFSQKALEIHLETQLHAAVRSSAHQLPLAIPPPYDANTLLFFCHIGLRWNPSCPLCRAWIPAPPREVKRLTELAKTIRTIATGEGLAEVVDEELTEGNRVPVWIKFFRLRRSLL